MRALLVAVNKILVALDQLSAGAWVAFGTAWSTNDAVFFTSPISNYYMTCPISRASKTMAECMASRQQVLAAE